MLTVAPPFSNPTPPGRKMLAVVRPTPMQPLKGPVVTQATPYGAQRCVDRLQQSVPHMG